VFYYIRGSKSTAWEGGVRVPGFIKPPTWLPWPARDYQGIFHIADWLPTLLRMAGAEGRSWGSEVVVEERETW